MFEGTFALLDRSLRIDLRGRATHFVRLGLMAAIYFSLCYVLSERFLIGAPGLAFLNSIAYLDAAFITLLGIGFFSSTISEEKEEDTLGLMLMAGIRPLGILFGKSGGVLTQAMLLIAIQYPFMLLAITMGGVSHSQVWAVTVALLAFMIFLSGFGSFCSTIARSNRSSSTLMTTGLILYFAIAGMSKWIFWRHLQWLAKAGLTNEVSSSWSILETIGSACLYLELRTILSTGFRESAFSIQVTSNCTMGFIFFVLSWLFFGVATSHPATEANSRGLVPDRRAFFRFPPGRPWMNPFVWKDFHFVAGGVAGMIVRTLYYVCLGTSVYLFDLIFQPGMEPGEWIEPCLIFMSFSVAVDAGLVLARSLHDEVRGQTLTSIMMLPRSSIAMVYTKFGGAMIGWLPGPIIELVFAITNEKGYDDLYLILTNQNGFLAVMWFVIIPHLAALTALYVRWGAVPIAIGLAIGALIFSEILFSIVNLIFGNISWEFQNTISILLLVFVCIVCHLGILLRVQSLASK